jgi:hypothetical protein
MSFELLYFCTGIQDKNIPWKKDMKQFEAWKGTDLTLKKKKFFSPIFALFPCIFKIDLYQSKTSKIYLPN